MPRKRIKPTASQLKTFQTAADRDVLCWIYENEGKCRYAEKCQWLHLDRETGQYVPTVYIMNSLQAAPPKTTTTTNGNTTNNTNTANKAKTANTTNTANTKPSPSPASGDDVKNDSTKTEDAQELAKRFQLMMDKKIEQNLEKQKRDQEKAKNVVDENEEDNKEDNDNKLECIKIKDNKIKEDKKGEGGYGSYGTTWDRQNVCWEFNTFVGCRKGSKCKWAHQYLIGKDATHPYTGEKLNGMAVRKFRLTNNI